MAKRPPSSWTIGRSSGGITGTTSRIIQSGLLSDFTNASTTLRRLTARACFWPFEVLMVSSSSSASSSSGTCSSRSRTDSAPMPPRKYSPHPNGEPNRSFSSRKVVSSLMTSFGFISEKILKTSRRRSAASSRYASVSAISVSNVLRSSLPIFSRSSALMRFGEPVASAQSSSSWLKPSTEPAGGASSSGFGAMPR